MIRRRSRYGGRPSSRLSLFPRSPPLEPPPRQSAVTRDSSFRLHRGRHRLDGLASQRENDRTVFFLVLGVLFSYFRARGFSNRFLRDDVASFKALSEGCRIRGAKILSICMKDIRTSPKYLMYYFFFNLIDVYTYFECFSRHFFF